jgi:predicted transcriptional regulator
VNDLSDDAKELLNVLAGKGSSRWAAADLAHIYERPTPDVNKTIEELTSAALITAKASEIGRRKTDQLQVTEAGTKLLAEIQG